MRFSIVFIVLLLGCGPITPDAATPLTEETCDSKIQRASAGMDECELERDTYEAELQEAQELLNACNAFSDSQQEKIYSCNTLISTYERVLINNDCTTAGVTNEEVLGSSR